MEYLKITSYYQQERKFIEMGISNQKYINKILINILNNININIKMEIKRKSKRSRSNITIELEEDPSTLENSEIQFNLLAQLRSRLLNRI